MSPNDVLVSESVPISPISESLHDAQGYERVVLAEVMIPDTPNAFGDIAGADAIKEFAYEFARQGFGIDVNHDQQDIQHTDAIVVESFIAREGDRDFIPGSWVVGMRILSDDLWQKVLDNEINGFSFEALTYVKTVVLQNLRNRQVSGTTEPHPEDGHTHDYVVILDPLNKPIAGGTSVVNGHSHTIASHTVTNATQGHSHRYQVIDQLSEQRDDEADDSETE